MTVRCFAGYERRVYGKVKNPRFKLRTWGTRLVFIWMRMAVIPVLRLLFLVRLRIFVRSLVVFRKVLPPGVIFVVIPVVIILVLFIVDSVLIATLLRYGDGHNCHWRRKRSGQK
jgi:hypothetical protein